MPNCSRSGRIPAAFATSALAICLSTAAAGQEKTVVTFANWAVAESATRPGIEAVIAEFEAANPDIDIETEAVSFSEIAQQLVLRIRAGNPPDVAEIAGNDLFLLAATGGLEPITPHLEEELKAKLKDAALNNLQHQGELIAMPWTLAPAGFWYNKSILEQAGLDPNVPPKTIDELMAAMAAIEESQPDVIPLALDTTNRSFAMISNWPWMRTFGAIPVGGSGTGADSPEMKQYLEWMRKIAQEGYIEPGRKIGEFRPLAAQGKIAFIWDQVLLQGVIQSVNGMSDQEFYDTWGVTTLPTGPSGEPYTFGGGHQLIMFGDSETKEAAWKFIKHLATSPEAILNYTIGYESSLPPMEEPPTEEIAKELDTPVFNAFSQEIIPTLTMPPYGPEFAAASTAVMAGVQQAVTGDQPIDEIAGSIQQRLER